MKKGLFIIGLIVVIVLIFSATFELVEGVFALIDLGCLSLSAGLYTNLSLNYEKYRIKKPNCFE